MKNARIKGTEFELPNPHIEPTLVWFNDKNSRSGGSGWLPKEWVEFYDPPREEPVIGSVELDDNDNIYIHMGNDIFGDPWRCFNPVTGHAGHTSWDRMPKTKPMIVKG